jgi:Tfp pilus assembly protein PilN
MRTNRADASRAFVNQFMVYLLVAICGSATIGLGTVWMRHQISLAANENKVLEAQIADVERHIEETDAAVAAEQDPAVLNQKNAEWHLGLVSTSVTQVHRVPEDPVLRLASVHNRKLFGEGTATISLQVALAH